LVIEVAIELFNKETHDSKQSSLKVYTFTHFRTKWKIQAQLEKRWRARCDKTEKKRKTEEEALNQCTV